nr:HIT domain-containing protein [Candidatus Freyarchaeota archaeon]
MCACPLCDLEKFKEKDSEGNVINRVLYSDVDEDFYVAIPQEPAMEGHLLVVSKDHIKDITEIENRRQLSVLSKMIKVSAKISRELKKWDKSISKVYILCEGETQHLHFHLKPRREREETGDLFLFEKELQESRWVLDSENKSEVRRATLEKGIERIKKGIALAEKHKTLIKMGEWLKPRKEVEEFYKNMIKKELGSTVTDAINSLKKKVQIKQC